MKLLLWLIACVNLVVGKQILSTLPCHDYCYAKEWPCLDCYNKCMQHSSKLQCDQDDQPKTTDRSIQNDQPKTTTQRPTTNNISPPEAQTFSCDKMCYASEHPCLDCYNKCMQQCEKKYPPKVAVNLVRTTAGLPNRKNRFGWFNPA